MQEHSYTAKVSAKNINEETHLHSEILNYSKDSDKLTSKLYDEVSLSDQNISELSLEHSSKNILSSAREDVKLGQYLSTGEHRRYETVSSMLSSQPDPMKFGLENIDKYLDSLK